MTNEQRIEQARQAALALEHFLDPAFQIVAEEYERRLREICAATPWETNKIAAMANATRIVTEVRNQIAAIVADGDDARAKVDRAKEIENLSPAKRRLLGIGQF